MEVIEDRLPSDRLISFFNIVIHMLFASAVTPFLSSELENKITQRSRQAKFIIIAGILKIIAFLTRLSSCHSAPGACEIDTRDIPSCRPGEVTATQMIDVHLLTTDDLTHHPFCVTPSVPSPKSPWVSLRSNGGLRGGPSRTGAKGSQLKVQFPRSHRPKSQPLAG